MKKYNGWVKYFADGTKEEGYDHLVEAKKASWSKGRLSGIVAVSVTYNDMTVTTYGTGNWWQEDVYEAVVGVNGGKIVERRVYKDIHKDDRFICLNTRDDKHWIWTISPMPIAFADTVKEIYPHHIGQHYIEHCGCVRIYTTNTGKTIVNLDMIKRGDL